MLTRHLRCSERGRYRSTSATKRPSAALVGPSTRDSGPENRDRVLLARWRWHLYLSARDDWLLFGGSLQWRGSPRCRRAYQVIMLLNSCEPIRTNQGPTSPGVLTTVRSVVWVVEYETRLGYQALVNVNRSTASSDRLSAILPLSVNSMNNLVPAIAYRARRRAVSTRGTPL